MGFWANVIVLVLLAIILPTTIGALGIGIADVLSQFPLFDVAIGVIAHQPLGTIIASKGLLNFLLEIFEFLAFAIIIEYITQYLEDRRWNKTKPNAFDRLFSLPITFVTSVLLRFCLIVIIYYGKTQLGQFGLLFSVGFSIFVAVLILFRILRDRNIWEVLSKTIIPLLFASADMLGLLYVCEGIYRSSTGLEGMPLLVIGIVTMVVVRGIRLLKNFVGF